MPEEIVITTSSARETIDDDTVAYIVFTQKYFEDLRQVAAQLAGLLVLAAAGGKSATPDHPMFEAAERLHVKGVDGDIKRVIPFHEERLKDHYPSRVTSAGLRITELVLANGEPSRVR